MQLRAVFPGFAGVDIAARGNEKSNAKGVGCAMRSGLPLALLGSEVSEPEVTYKSRPDCRCE